MGKKKQGGGLGKSIIKDRFGKRTVPKGDNFLHTSELKDGYDWGRLNLQSVTEQSNLEDFLTTAELAGTEFTAEKLNIQFVDPQKNSGFLSSEEQNRIKQLHEEHKSLIRIPRRPSWNENTTAEELDSAERSSFLDWRRTLSVLQDIEGIVLTPYEKNLDFWRQLWRVIERSDVIVQVVDARNPLLFRCEDVEKYVTEVDSTKVNLVLINKADFLSEGQRKIWCDFFNKKNVRVAFWSALNEADRQAEETQENKEDENSSLDVINSESDDDSDVEERDAGLEQSCDPSTSEDRTVNPQTVERMEEDVRDTESDSHNIKDSEESRLNQCEIDSTQNSEIDTSDNQERGHHLGSVSNNKSNSQQTDDVEMDHSASENDQQSAVSGVKSVAGDCDVSQTLSGATGGVQNDGTILTGTELLDLLKRLHTGEKVQKDVTTIGMVGYPNVGKSSTINAILKMKKVPVSATPGRTKHFQTLYVENDLMLCDCPGLVFPSFVSTKAELIVNGILPIDQMRDHAPPVSLVCHHIPKDALETIYGVNIPPPPEGEDPFRPPTSDEFLGAYGSMRGFMTARGLPDCPRAARYILKDYVNGRLLYCHPPPDVDAESFEPTAGLVETIKQKQTKSSSSKVQKTQPQSRLDREFFRKTDSSIHSKGAHGGSSFTRTQGLQQVSGSGSTPNSSMQSLSEKPWKKHHNRGKKEKLRKVYKDDDYL